MKILLIVPPLNNIVKYLEGWHLNPEDYGSFPPLGLLYIATLLKEKMPDIEVRVVDSPSQRLGYADIGKIIKDFKPDVLGICAFTECLVDVLKVARLAKSINRDIHITVGGPHLFVYPHQTLEYPEIDSIVIGEGEYVFCELINMLKEGKAPLGIDGLYLKSDLGKREFKKAAAVNLDALPVFDVDLIKRRFYYSTIGSQRNVITLLTSRGCPYKCTFCDVPYREFRGRNMANIMEEIELRLRQGFKEIFFFDDTFNITPQRVIELSRRIIKDNLKFEWSFRGRVNTATFEMLKLAKAAGCRRIHFGIETGTDEGLQELKKGITIEQIKNALSWCRQLKIKTIGDFIIGLPFEKSPEDVIRNIQRLVEFGPDYAQFNFLQPIPGSEIYELGIKRGIIDAEKWENFVRFPNADFQPPLWTEYLNREDIAGLFHLAYKKFYMHPRTILRTLSGIRTIHELKRTLKGATKIIFRN